MQVVCDVYFTKVSREAHMTNVYGGFSALKFGQAAALGCDIRVAILSDYAVYAPETRAVIVFANISPNKY